MPQYDYKCTKCVAVKTIIMNIKEHEKVRVFCDCCGSFMYQMVAAPAIVNRANLRIPRSGKQRIKIQ
jgi:predicted nucleic acid-binding Zn ribbon protein